jgi:hypothetical protein
MQELPLRGRAQGQRAHVRKAWCAHASRPLHVRWAGESKPVSVREIRRWAGQPRQLSARQRMLDASTPHPILTDPETLAGSPHRGTHAAVDPERRDYSRRSGPDSSCHVSRYSACLPQPCAPPFFTAGLCVHHPQPSKGVRCHRFPCPAGADSPDSKGGCAYSRR